MRLFGLLLLAPLVAGSCSTPSPPPIESDADGDLPVLEVREVWYPGREQLKKRYVVRIDDGRARKHGTEEEWFEDGSRKAEREFREGEPFGTWRTWHAPALGGNPESIVEIGDGTEVLPMRWWHPDGTLHAEGQGKGGVREGAWSYYFPGGGLAARGSFAASRREGFWQIYDETGRLRAEGDYRGGRRVGRWRLWDELGTLFENEDASLVEEVLDPGGP